MMKKRLYLLFLLLLSVQLAIAQTACYEYWLDNDRDGRMVVADDVQEVTLNLDISAMKPGLHYFSFRAQDKSGQWGGLSRYLFMLKEGDGSSATMAQYEYWLDNNYEQRTVTQGSAFNSPMMLDISSLKSGLHYFNFRAQDKTGQWGGLSRYLFMLKEGDGSSATMTQYEYWLDNNYEQRTAVQGSAFNSPMMLDISSLKPGLHYFSFRTQSKSGQWGGLSRYLFMLKEEEDSSATMVQYEYWLDNNYEQRTVIQGSAFNSPMMLDISSLKSGMHYFNFRAQDKSGQWGGLSRYLFYVKDGIGQGLVANIEYWIDERQEVMTQQVTDSTVVITVDITNLAAGQHTFTLEGKTPSGYSGLLASYEFVNSALPVLPNPVITHEGNLITITVEPDTASQELPVVYYTLDGTTPNAENGTKYDGPFTVTYNMTIRAIGVQDGYADSPIAELTVDWFKVADPTFVQVGNQLTISTITEGATIYYSIGEGVQPETLYTGPITLDDERPINAIGYKEGYTASEIVTYVPSLINTAVPDMSYNGRYLQLYCPSSSDATIYYTLDGTEPTHESAHYDGEIEISELCTVKAFAQADGLNGSSIVEWSIDYLFNGTTAYVRNDARLTDAFVWCGGVSHANRLAAIVWDADRSLTEAEMTGVDNPNLLLYVKSASYAPATVKNVVVNDVAESIVLTDANSGNSDFFSPKSFTARSISYTHEYRMRTESGICRGWETIALPFTVESVTHEKHGKLTPFGGDGWPFWLAEMTASGLSEAHQIEANTPYIISMPNNPSVYSEDYIQAGRVTFSAQNATIPATSQTGITGGNVTFVPTFQSVDKSPDIYAINRNEAYKGNPEGSIFVADYREVRPFEAYTLHSGTGTAPLYMSLADMLSASMTNIDSIKEYGNDIMRIYTLSGTLVKTGKTNKELYQLPKGVYIVNGKKVVVK